RPAYMPASRGFGPALPPRPPMGAPNLPPPPARPGMGGAPPVPEFGHGGYAHGGDFFFDEVSPEHYAEGGSTLKSIAKRLQSKGQDEDKILAHINPEEAQ